MNVAKDSFILYQGYNYRGRCDGRYSQILDSYAVKELTGEHILPLPERIEHYYTAEEGAKMISMANGLLIKLNILIKK